MDYAAAPRYQKNAAAGLLSGRGRALHWVIVWRIDAV